MRFTICICICICIWIWFVFVFWLSLGGEERFIIWFLFDNIQQVKFDFQFKSPKRWLKTSQERRGCTQNGNRLAINLPKYKTYPCIKPYPSYWWTQITKLHKFLKYCFFSSAHNERVIFLSLRRFKGRRQAKEKVPMWRGMHVLVRWKYSCFSSQCMLQRIHVIFFLTKLQWYLHKLVYKSLDHERQVQYKS